MLLLHVLALSQRNLCVVATRFSSLRPGIMEYGSTPYVGMAWEKNGVHI